MSGADTALVIDRGGVEEKGECHFCLLAGVPVVVKPERFSGVHHFPKIAICGECIDWASDQLNSFFDSRR